MAERKVRKANDLKCPKTATVTAQALQKLRHGKERERHEEDSLEATSGNRRKRCGRDMLGQTVPSTGSSNRESPVVDHRRSQRGSWGA